MNLKTSLDSLEAALKWHQQNRIAAYYPEDGPLRRSLYVKHCECFAAGAKHRERGVVSANRVGKSEGIGAYEVTLHLTGRYPSWWVGHRFTKPISAWVSGDTNQTTRDIIQAKLLGKIKREPGEAMEKAVGVGSGMIPADAIKTTKPKSGVQDGVEVAYIYHVSGGISTLVFKSYEQGREAFQGTEQDLIWLDEECEEGIYNECLMRTMATGRFDGGIILLTFTPLSGWSEVVDKFLDPEERVKANRHVTQMGWDDAPHLSRTEKDDMLAKLPPHEREARSKGIPRLGSGAIYPIAEEAIQIAPFEIPAHWPRGYALDVGLRTAAIWAAHDRDSDTLYFYSEYFREDGDIPVHSSAIKSRGVWLPGFIDPASRGRSQTDGQRVIELYRREGLNVVPAINAVEAGIYEVWQRMTSGRLKVFTTLTGFFQEFRLYRRDEKGKIVKKNDHRMDCGRYVTMAIPNLETSPKPKKEEEPRYVPVNRYGGWGGGSSWMGS